MRKRTLFIILLFCSILLASAGSATPVKGQPGSIETAGPGWRLAEAGPVSPAKTRRYLGGRSQGALHTTTALPDSETKATIEIEALARALEYDPMLIFDHVRNHIDYVPTFGSVNGATATLLAGRGNDWDQTSLFIALMRASGYTADYVIGDITYSTTCLANWLGVGAASVGTTLAYGGIPAVNLGGAYRITRAWAQADMNGETYIFDPAMKSYNQIDGIDLAAAAGYNRTNFMTQAQEGATVASDLAQFMNEANVRSDLAAYSMNLVDTIRSSAPGANLAEIIGGREILITEMVTYTKSLPDALAVANKNAYSSIPASYRHTLRIEHHGIDHTFDTFQIAGKRVSIFNDAGDNYRPLLKVDGDLIAAGEPTSPGGIYELTLTIDHPYAALSGTFADQSGSLELVSGYDYVITHDFNTTSADLIATRSKILNEYTSDSLADDSESVRGESLWLMGLNYSYEDQLFASLLGQIGKGVFIQHHLVGLVSQQDGYMIDLPLSTTSFAPSGGASAQTAYRAYSMMGSALEHGVLEQMQGSNRKAVSSIKVIQLNNQAGNMTFLADAGNWNAVKPFLKNYLPGDLAFIEDYILNGYAFVLPEDGGVSLNQWTGSGYIGYTGVNMGMWVYGNYAGGMVTWVLDILLKPIQDLLLELLNDPFNELNSKIPESDDPVDMYSGAFHLESLDLKAGPDGLLDLAFNRAYNSGSNTNLGPMGYGWSHNQQTSLSFHDDYEVALGRRHPTDAASMIVFAQVILDVLGHEENIQGWMAADLATKWAMDQLTDNAVTAHFGTTTAEYTVLANGAYNPPTGAYQQLLQQGEYYYAQGPGNTCTIFDTQGRGRIWTDANGNTLTYNYDGDGRLLSVGSSTLEQSLVFTYTGDLLTGIGDQSGRSITLEYTGNELTLFRDAEGNAYTYTYDSSHRLTTVTRPLGNTVVTNKYDELGRVLTQTDALSNTTTFIFSGYRNVESYAEGNRMTHYFDAQGRTTGNQDKLGNRTHQSYDGQSRLITLTDRLGDTISYTYDPLSGQITGVTNPDGGAVSYSYTPQNYACANPLNGENVVMTAYNLTRIEYADGSSESLAYDPYGNLASHVDLAGETWEYQHNARGQQTLVVNPAGGQTTYTYNSDGTQASSLDSDTGIITYGYDAFKRRDRVTHPDGSFIQTSYDQNDKITSLTDERDQTTTYEYDANGNLVRTIDPLGAETTYVYNQMDQVTQETNRRGKTTFYTYDERGRLASVIDPNESITQYEYDSYGWLTGVTDPDGHMLENEYNAEGQKTATTTPLDHTSTFDYDTQGHLIDAADPLGRLTHLTRNSLGLIISSSDPLGRITYYSYNKLGLTAGVRLPGGETTAYQYNDLGHLSNVRDANGSQWSFTYTPMGRLQSRTDPLGNQWAYSYNQQGLLAQVDYPTESKRDNLDNEAQLLTYDPAGNLIRRQYSEGPDLSFTYDAVNRITAANGISLTYNSESQVIYDLDTETWIESRAAYDDGGRLETLTYAGGLFTVTYQYNPRGLLTHVSDNLTDASMELFYDDDGRLIVMQRSNGMDAILTWDDASQLTRIQEEALADLEYTFNLAGELVQTVMSTPLDPADYIMTGTINLSYDAASQISSPGYEYDAQGRLTADPWRSYT
ncbi:MAG: hypothetical protein JXA42_07095, partial [Anaerolineales bacterium]|nr:hypothetical protein [Anaerolineales bacterium]